MANMTLSIPDELLIRMKKFNEIKWSEVARKAIDQRTKDLEMIEKIASKSKLTQEDATEISKKIKLRANKRFLNENNN
jgi:predicted CopG family antitoxin